MTRRSTAPVSKQRHVLRIKSKLQMIAEDLDQRMKVKQIRFVQPQSPVTWGPICAAEKMGARFFDLLSHEMGFKDRIRQLSARCMPEM